MATNTATRTRRVRRTRARASNPPSANAFVEVLKALRAETTAAADRVFFPNGINLIDVEVKSGLATVHVRVSGGTTLADKAVSRPATGPRPFKDGDWTPDEIKKTAENLFDQTTAGTNCATNKTLPREDCNCYIKNTVRLFISSLPFDKPNTDADTIIAALADSASGWTALGKDPDAAMGRTAAGDVVIAGMTSGELGDPDGHLALAVDGKEASGTWGRDFPLCTAGSTNPKARVKDRGVHFTFPVKKAPEIRYFARTPDLPPPTALLHVQEK